MRSSILSFHRLTGLPDLKKNPQKTNNKNHTQQKALILAIQLLA